MLFTRCPDCGTTFRVTDDALTKANGQVRCGRCASVFNAYAELRDPPSEVAPAQDAASAADSRAPSSPAVEAAAQSPSPDTASVAQPPSAAHASALPPPVVPAALAAPAAPPPETAEPAPQGPRAAQPAAASPGLAPRASPAAPAVKAVPRAPDEAAGDRVTLSVADVVAQVGLIADEDAETGEMEADRAALAHANAMSAEEVNDVLDSVAERGTEAAPWPLSARPRRASRWWSAAALAATVALGAQAIHHFRADLVRYAVIGPVVQDAYAMVGARVLPRVDVRQYQILDWVATAEPNTLGRGSLKITARIQNRAQRSQPYPSVQVQLKDRWEAAVGSRVFAPKEYGAQAKELMAPGETARAEIEVVDPGPDAYGFELDVCIEVETDVISCGADKVFL